MRTNYPSIQTPGTGNATEILNKCQKNAQKLYNYSTSINPSMTIEDIESMSAKYKLKE